MRGYTRLLIGLNLMIAVGLMGAMLMAGLGQPTVWGGDFTATPTPVSDNPIINQYFIEAEALACKGNFEKAAEVMQQAIDADPTFALSYVFHTLAYLHTQSPDILERVSQDAETAIRMAPESWESYVLSATVLAANGDYEAAIADITTGIQFMPPDRLAGGYNARAHFYQYMGETDLALADNTHALELDPNDIDALTLHARLYLELGNYDRALAYADTAYQAMLEQDDGRDCVLGLQQNAKVMSMRGQVYLQREELSQAIQDFTQALSFDPTNTTAHEGRANAYFRLGQDENALPDLFRLVELSPDYARGYILIATVYFDQNNWDKAVAYANQGLRLAPDYVEGYSIRAASYWGAAEFEEALADFTQVITLDPNLADGYLFRGTLYNQLGQKAEALADLKEYQRLAGESADPSVLTTIQQLETELGN